MSRGVIYRSAGRAGSSRPNRDVLLPNAGQLRRLIAPALSEDILERKSIGPRSEL
jgi:hypothetical protein